MICQPPTDVDANINIAVAVFGVLTCLLNSFVIGRILSQNLKKVHQSKVFFFNMALADVYYGLSSVFYVLGAFELIDFEGVEKEHIVRWLAVSLSFSSFTSLSHVLLITADRFMATTFPLIHKVYVTRRKIILAVAFMWILSLVLALIPLYSTTTTDISIWITAIVGACGYVILSLTYFHIAIVGMKRRKSLKQNRSANTGSSKGSGSRSINTTFLSVSITSSYIACTSYGIVHAILFLLDEVVMNKRMMMTNELLLNVNACMNPILYTIVEVVHKRYSLAEKK